MTLTVLTLTALTAIVLTVIVLTVIVLTVIALLVVVLTVVVLTVKTLSVVVLTQVVLTAVVQKTLEEANGKLVIAQCSQHEWKCILYTVLFILFSVPRMWNFSSSFRSTMVEHCYMM